MQNDFVILEREGAVASLILNRPEKRNALSLDVMRKITELLKQISHDSSIGVVILKGNGPVFCAGHDLQEIMGQESSIHYRRTIFQVCSEMMLFIHRMPQPVIAQVHGVATAAGCQLVASCDLAVAESGARFATPGVKIGLFCATPMVPLVRVIGRRRAMEMLLTGRFVSAQEALEWGLVNKVTEPEKLEEETRAFAEEIAGYSRSTIALGKKAFYDQIDIAEPFAYGYAREVIVMNSTYEDAKEGIQAFLEKRPPMWRHK